MTSSPTHFERISSALDSSLLVFLLRPGTLTSLSRPLEDQYSFDTNVMVHH